MPPRVDHRLIERIGSPAIAAKATELLGLARAALHALAQLDESLYERMIANRTEPLSPEASIAIVGWVWDDLFGGLYDFLDLCKRFAEESGPIPDEEIDMDMGGFDAISSAPRSDFSLGLGDIGDALASLDAPKVVDAPTKWMLVVQRLSSIEYGLRSQLEDGVERREVGFKAQQINSVLELLDDLQSSTSEGVLAAITALYEQYDPETDPTTLVPEHHTTLGRALMVRRALAELAAAIGPANDALQADLAHPDEQLAIIRVNLDMFVSSEMCKGMRPADRWQLVELARRFVEEPPSQAHLIAEGLVKYLESLWSVSQREVLLRHDEKTLDELRETLATARQLLELSPRTVGEMLTQAIQKAQALKGRSPSTDRVLARLEEPGLADASPLVRLEVLEELIAGTS